jgi:hypothetical protein
VTRQIRRGIERNINCATKAAQTESPLNVVAAIPQSRFIAISSLRAPHYPQSYAQKMGLNPQ